MRPLTVVFTCPCHQKTGAHLCVRTVCAGECGELVQYVFAVGKRIGCFISCQPAELLEVDNVPWLTAEHLFECGLFERRPGGAGFTASVRVFRHILFGGVPFVFQGTFTDIAVADCDVGISAALADSGKILRTVDAQTVSDNENTEMREIFCCGCTAESG